MSDPCVIFWAMVAPWIETLSKIIGLLISAYVVQRRLRDISYDITHGTGAGLWYLNGALVVLTWSIIGSACGLALVG